MSTRCTMAWAEFRGVTYHLFTDCLDDDGTVYLEVWRRGIGSVLEMSLSPVVWEFLRGFQAPAFEQWLMAGTASDARSAILKDVDERIAAGEKNPKAFLVMGDTIYGPWDSPRETQIARGMAVVKRQRAKLSRLQKAVKKLRSKSQ